MSPTDPSSGQQSGNRAWSSARTIVLATAALLCFAGNSLLCRLALAEQRTDAVSFTAVRLVTGATVLGVLVMLRGRSRARAATSPRRRWLAAAGLFTYAAAFSVAYVELGAGTGALILFGCVQLTMIGWGVARGERPRMGVWLGLACALSGLLGLTLPGATAPNLGAALWMAAAGIGWGIYSLCGRGELDPLRSTAVNFGRCVPPALLWLALAFGTIGVTSSAQGLALAAVSGGLASGLGYTFWYGALTTLAATRAAVLQLLVPVLAAVGGVILLGEALTLRLVSAGALVLFGVGVALRSRA